MSPQKLNLEQQIKAADGKRFAVGRVCICTAQDRSNGWGCCCSWPIRVYESEQGSFKLVLVDSLEQAESNLADALAGETND